MKKSLFKFVYILLILFPIIAYADGIENFYINATLEENGNLRVQEYFNLEGKYNGFNRIIDYANENAYTFRPELNSYGGSKLHNGTSITINEIRAVDVSSKFNFSSIKGDKFTKVENANIGDYGVYTETKGYNSNTYSIYLPSDEEKAFYIDYTINDLAILHNDVGELGWNIFTDLTENVKNVQITVNFPNNQNEFRVWAHGPLNGVVTPKDNNTLIASIQNLYAYTSFDVRATFDKELIPSATKKTGVDALQKILNYEEDKAEKANYERQQSDYQRQTAAQEKIWYCYDFLNRSCYNEAVNLVSKVNDQTKKADLTSQLDELNILVTQLEETTAKESVEFAENFIRYTWYKQAINDTTILTNEELKNELLERLKVVEEKIAKEENKSYIKFKLYNYGTLLVIICIVAYMYYYHDREYKSSFKEFYLREKPNDYSPSTVSYLFKRKITNEAISAEILELINKGIITCEKITTNKKEDYMLSKNSKYNKALSAKEEALIRLVLNSSSSTKLSTIKKNASSSYRSFLSRWDKVQSYCVNEALSENIYVDDSLAKYKKSQNVPKEILKIILYIIGILLIQTILLSIPGVILLCYANKMERRTQTNIDIKKSTSKKVFTIILILIMISSIASIIYIPFNYHFINSPFTLPTICLILSIIAMIYVSVCQKRTETGAYEFTRWKAFKHFLCDFGKMDIKEVGEVKLWKEYLVYATVLGCADKVEKAMKIKVKELNLEETDFTISDYYIFHNISNDIYRGIRDAHDQAVSSKIASESSSSSSSGGSSWSSGSGGGGGFSSGGGSFGGGGGGGRF